MSCIFCRIRDGEAPSYKVYEDKYTIAFLDINPVADGHVLLIPREHTKYIEDLPEEIVERLMKTLIKLLPPIQRAFNAKDSNISINNGPNAGQLVSHVHIHIIPRPTRVRAQFVSNVSRFKPHNEDYYKEIAAKISKEIEISR